MDLFNIQQKFATMGVGTLTKSALDAATRHGGGQTGPTSERGLRTTPEQQLKYAWGMYQPDLELRSRILDIRQMHHLDPRVKRIHMRTSRAAVKGGLILDAGSHLTQLHQAWGRFKKRLHLDRREKLTSHMMGLMMEGNLPIQWVINPGKQVAEAIRMPTDTLKPLIAPNGRFIDPAQAYEQWDLTQGKPIATFAVWQLSIARLDPDNWDDWGSMGRPYLDATREVWQRLTMTEEDMVIRRHDRAISHNLHTMEGMTQEELEMYSNGVEQDRREGTGRDYYANKKGSVTSIENDANLDQIKDVVYLLDTFFAGSPAAKGIFGYTDGLSRDILEDLKREYYDEIDGMQDTATFVYELGFKLDLLLQGISPDNLDFTIKYAERRTETPNQAIDRALKEQALNLPDEYIWRTAGYEPEKVKAIVDLQKKSRDPYPDHDDDQDLDRQRPRMPRVKITPGNQRKDDSGTAITND